MTRMNQHLRSFRDRMRGESEEGFSLVELAFVLVIIAILIAIAIPTFLGIQRSSQNRQAQSNLRNALSVARGSVYADNGSYPDTDATRTALTAAEPNLTFVSGSAALANPETIHVGVSDGTLTLTVKAASGSCFQIEDSPETGTTGPSSVTCPGAAPAPTTTTTAG